MIPKLILGVCLILCVLLAVFSPLAMQAARDGFSLFTSTVLPALLPYLICTSLICSCGIKRAQLMLPALALISGAPSGARFAALADTDERTASRLAAALNAASPAFVAGAFCSGMLGVQRAAVPMLIAQYFSAGIMLIPLFTRIRLSDSHSEAPSFSQAVRRSMDALISICGTVVFFSVLIKLFDRLGIFEAICRPLAWAVRALGGSGKGVRAALTGMMEMVLGVNAAASSGLGARAAASLACAVFSFGGLCIMAQSGTFLRIRIGAYLISKLIQAVIAGTVCYIIFPVFGGVKETVFIPPSGVMLQNAAVTIAVLLSSLFGMAVILLISAAASGVKRSEAQKKPAR